MRNTTLRIWSGLGLFVCVCAVAASGGAQRTVSAGEVPVPGGGARRAGEVEAAVLSAFRQANIKTAAVAVATDGGPVFTRALGVRVGDQGGPADDDTVFRAASLGKPVFAYLVLTLVKDGRLDLDRPLHAYLPKPLPRFAEYADLAGDSRYEAITARLVLTHRTGFPNWRWQSPDRKLRVLFEPGTKFSYSGEGYMYLQFVVEQMTGAGLEALAAQRVFTPLGMSRTSFVWRDEYGANSAIDRAPIEKFFGAGFLALPNSAGSLLTTARDYGRFLAAVLAGTGLPSGLRDDMLRPHVTIDADRLFGPPAATRPATDRERGPFWCLGWGGFTDAAGAARFHVGYDSPEYANYAVLYPGSRMGVVVLTAGGSGPDTSCPKFVEALIGRTSTPFQWMGY